MHTEEISQHKLARHIFNLAKEVCDELPTAQWNIVLTIILGRLISFIACTTNVLILVAIYKKLALHSVTNYFLVL